MHAIESINVLCFRFVAFTCILKGPTKNQEETAQVRTRTRA